MKLTSSQKTFVVILGLAVTAFLVDRLLLSSGSGGPEQAQASAGAAGSPLGPRAEPPQAAAAPEAGPQPDRPSLAERLKALAGSEGFDPASVKEAFAPSGPWLARPEPTTAPTSQPTPAQRFAQAQHRLTLVVLAGEGGWAIVDDKVIKVGQQLDGYTLVRLTHSRAIFRSGEDRVELRLNSEASP